MPWMYNVAVQSPEIFGDDEPVIFRPTAHSAEQALRMVLRELWQGQPNISMEDITTTTKRDRRVGGYDDPRVERYMRTRSGVQ